VQNSAGWILTSGPARTFCGEYSRLTRIGQHFSFINTTLYAFLEFDPQADRLRGFLAPFNRHMHHCVKKIQDGLDYGRVTYTHTQEELTGGAFPDPIADEDARLLLDQEMQESILRNARKVAGYFSEAIEQLQQALKCLPDLERELNGFVDGYSERSRLINERSQSWVPSLVQDFFMGAIDPVTLEVSQVEALPQDLSTGSKLLTELANFLDRIKLHFTLLSEFEQSKMTTMGISTMEDLRRLYSDRLTSGQYMLEMSMVTFDIHRAFAYGSEAVAELQARSK
jgi:hypothetical protein